MNGKLRQLTILAVVATVAVAALGWFLLISPKNKQASDLRAKAVAQRVTNDTLRNQLAILQGQEKNLVNQQAKLATIAGRIPDNPALPSLIRGLSDAADRAGVDLMTLAPSAPAVVAATVTPVAPPAAGVAGKPATSVAPPAQLAEIPISVTISGGFFPIEQFLSNLEDLPRSFQVTGMSATPGSATTASGTRPKVGQQLQVTLNGRVFMSPSVAAPAPVVAPPAAAPTK